jgi:hypothetical protein
MIKEECYKESAMWKKLLWLGMSITTLFLGIELLVNSNAYGEDFGSKSAKVDVKVLEGYISSDSPRPTSNSNEKYPLFYNEGRIYAVTKNTKVPSGTHLKHLWFLRDQIILDANLPVKDDQIKSVSGLILKPNWTGKWRVDITAEDGTLLYTIPFIVQKRSVTDQASAETPSTTSNQENVSGISHVSMTNLPSTP